MASLTQQVDTAVDLSNFATFHTTQALSVRDRRKLCQLQAAYSEKPRLMLHSTDVACTV